MKYKLKKNIENFDVVDGPLAGRQYRRGKVYDEKDISPGQKGKFEPLEEAKSSLRPIGVHPPAWKPYGAGLTDEDAPAKTKNRKPKTN